MIALIAPYDKTGAADLARGLVTLGFDIVSTSGTLKHLTEAGVPARSVSDLTGFPEILDGRVKTLHPAVHAGLLARRDKPEHMEELARQGLVGIDLVAVNLYPFRETVAKPAVTEEDALENIDIGGPTMLRAAAKNFPSVLVLVDPSDYAEALTRLKSEDVPLDYRRQLAEKAFQHVASYDTAIAAYLRSAHPEISKDGAEAQRTDSPNSLFPQQLTIGLEKAADLRYGENPHQSAAVYRDDSPGEPRGVLAADLLHGLDMSYLNYSRRRRRLARGDGVRRLDGCHRQARHPLRRRLPRRHRRRLRARLRRRRNLALRRHHRRQPRSHLGHDRGDEGQALRHHHRARLRRDEPSNASKSAATFASSKSQTVAPPHVRTDLQVCPPAPLLRLQQSSTEPSPAESSPKPPTPSPPPLSTSRS